jgi:hypothetical protein
MKLMRWMTEDGTKIVLAGEILRTRLPVVMLDNASTGVVLRYLPGEEERYMHPVVEKTRKDPYVRFRKLARNIGCTKAARKILFTKDGGNDAPSSSDSRSGSCQQTT